MSYDDGLKRLSAILLLVLIGLTPIVPGFGSDTATNLPACCRRAGKHHCSMPDDQPGSGSATGFRANGRCAQYPPVVLSQREQILSKIPALDSVSAASGSFEIARPQERLCPHATLSAAHLKRGPPSFYFVG
jgi:hypothetical protein